MEEKVFTGKKTSGQFELQPIIAVREERALSLKQRAEVLRQKLFEVFGDNGKEVAAAKAAGRVNLIGEHTDYNDGFVLPMAIDREIIMVGQANTDGMVRLFSMDFDACVEFRLDAIKRTEENSWANYPKGVIKLLQEAGKSVQGMNVVLSGNVPQGAGLSSSAALEVVTAYLVKLISGFEMEDVKIVQLCQRAENTFVGVNCGIMDQFISCMGKKDHALFLDCRSLEYQLVPLPDSDDYKVVICNTAVKRGLVDSAYNQRRSQCEEGVRILQQFLSDVKALRDVTVEQFERYKEKLPAAVAARCQHVIYENQRVLDSVQALRQGDVQSFGQYMNESHISLRDLYEVSCPELNVMVELAQAVPGVVGSRMTGAGFGGCTVSLVKADSVEEFLATVPVRYKEKTGLEPEVYVCTAQDGAVRIQL